MNTITKLILFCFVCTCISLNAQTENNLQELLDRLEENHMGSLYDVYTQEEIEILKVHFNTEKEPFTMFKVTDHRRIATTQSVEPVTSAVILLTEMGIITGPISPVPEFEGAGMITMEPEPGIQIVDNEGGVWERDPLTGEYGKIATITLPNNQSVTGLERISDGTIYAIGTNGAGLSALYTLNPDTYSPDLVGENNLVVPIALGRDGDENLYTVDIDDDKLYKFNKGNGAVTEIGDIDYDANFGQGMTYDPLSDKMLMIAFNNDIYNSEIREFDLATGMSTSLGNPTPGLSHFGWGAFYDNNELSVNDNSQNEFTIFPNPAQNKIKINASFDINTVEIYSILGQKVISLTINNTSSEIDISKLSSGAYLVKITSDGKISTQKLIKI